MSTIKVDTIQTRTGSGNITASNTIAGTSATLSGTLAVSGNISTTSNTISITNSSYPQLQINGSTKNWSLFADAGGPLYIKNATDNSNSVLIHPTGGVSFNGDTAAANVLDDYEEGTYTPTVASTGTNPTVTYSIQEGNYTKIGNQVTVTGNIQFSAYTGNGGSFRLEGVPFNVATHTNYRAVGSVMLGSVASNLTGDYTSLQLSYNSGTSMQILMNNSVTGGVAETPANSIDAGTIIRYQITYIVA